MVVIYVDDNNVCMSHYALLPNWVTDMSPLRHLHALFLCSAGLQAVLRAGLVASGALTVKDEATGLVVALLDPQPGDCILDACAAPGGKALFMAARLQGRVCARNLVWF